MVPILGENGRKYNISTKKYNILRPHLFDISWFKRQSLTFMSTYILFAVILHRMSAYKRMLVANFTLKAHLYTSTWVKVGENLL